MVSNRNVIVKGNVCEGQEVAIECRQAISHMRKEDRIGVRVPIDLKKALIQIARNEDRSLAQVCEIFLKEGVLAYKEDGAKYFHRLLSRQKKNVMSTDKA